MKARLLISVLLGGLCVCAVKGKSYRFVTVDAAVKVAGGVATVTSLGETKTFEAPRRFFTAQSHSPVIRACRR